MKPKESQEKRGRRKVSSTDLRDEEEEKKQKTRDGQKGKERHVSKCGGWGLWLKRFGKLFMANKIFAASTKLYL